MNLSDFSGPLVKNGPASAGDTSLIPDPGRSHVAWGSSACVPYSGAHELQQENPCSATGECLHLEKACKHLKTQGTAKNK